MNGNTGGPFQGPNQHIAGIGLLLGLAGLANNQQQQQQQMMGAPQPGGMGGFVRLMGPRQSSPMIRGQRSMMGSPAFQASPPVMGPELGGPSGIRQQGPHLAQADAVSAQSKAAALSKRILSRLGPEINDEPEFQEKMFLPSTVSSLDETALRQALLLHLQPITAKTGVHPQLRGGRDTGERLHFYLGTNEERSFNEAKRMIIVLVQTVVAEMLELMAEEEEEDDDEEEDEDIEDGTLNQNKNRGQPNNGSLNIKKEKSITNNEQHNASPANTEGEGTASVENLSRDDLRRHLAQTINVQKIQYENKLQEVQLKALPEKDPEIEILPPELPKGPLVVDLEDDEEPTPEEVELKKQMDQLKKAVDILGRVSKDPSTPSTAPPASAALPAPAAPPLPVPVSSAAAAPAISLLDRLREKTDRNTGPEAGSTGRVPIASRLSRPSPAVAERPLIPQLMELPLVQQQRGARPIVHPMLGVRLPPGTSFGVSPVNPFFCNDAAGFGLLGDAPAGKQRVLQPPPDATSNNPMGGSRNNNTNNNNNKKNNKKNNNSQNNVNAGNNRSVDGNNAISCQNNNQNSNNGRGRKKQRNKRNKQNNNNNRNNNNANNNRSQSRMSMAEPDVQELHVAGKDGAPPPPPLMEAPLINPALDYLYNPTVVKTIQSRGLGEAGSPAMEKDPCLTGGLQIGYLPDMEFGEEPEQPYSEMLNSSVDQQGEGQVMVDGRQPHDPRSRSRSHRDKKGSRSGDRHHKNHRGLDEVRRGGRNRSIYPEKAQQARRRSNSSHDPTCPSGVGGPHRRPEGLSVGSTGSGEHPQQPNLIDQQRTEITQKMAENTQRERSLERRERSLERRERKERDARRIRYERYERERRYEQAKRERDKWVCEEADRRQRYEREKRYMHDLELEFYERYERERRERFEGERREWEERERAKLRKELEEELEAEQEARNYGRTGPPVVYVSNVCPGSSEDKLHKHFSHYGQVTRVVLIRTRQKNVLQAEVYFDKWGHASRAVNAIPGAHVIDGYTLRVSHERFQLVCPITRMDELKVQKKPESFDEILRKYKMQAEIKKSRGVGVGGGQDTGCSSSYIPPPATSAAIDGFSSSVRDRRGGIFRSPDDYDRGSGGGIEILGSRGTAEFTARIDLRAPAPHEQEIVTLEMRRHRSNRGHPRQPAPFPYLEASGLQKLKFSSAAGKPIGRGGLLSVDDDKPRKLTLVLDTEMPYYNATLVSQCRYPVVEGTDVSVLKCSELLEDHWKLDGIQLVMSKGVGTEISPHQQELIYVVMPSTTFLVKHLIGDFLTDAISSGLVSGGYEETPAFKENLKVYIKSLSKHFREMSSYSSSKSDPFNSEVKLWLELLDKGSKDEECFLFDMTEDLVTVRGVLALNEKMNNVLKSLKQEGMLGLTEGGDPASNRKNGGEDGGSDGEEDISVVFEGEQTDGASSSKKKKRNKKLKTKSPLVCLLEVLAQRMRIDVCSGSASSAPVVVLDSDDEGTAGKQSSANSEDKENAPDSNNSASPVKNVTSITSPTKGGSGGSIQAFMMRRLLHEAFAVHHCLKTAAAASKGNSEGSEKAQRALVYTAYALDWMGPAAVKKAVSHIKRQKVVQGKPELERLVASLLQGIRLFNALARATWCMAGCARPIVANLHDSVREEGEVDEEGEIVDDDEVAGNEGRRRSGGDGSSRRRKHHHRHHHKDSKEESLERRKLHEEMKKVEEEKKKIEEERKEIEEMKRSIKEQTRMKEQEDMKRLQEMEEMKRRLQEELAAMAAETEPSSAGRRPSLVTSEAGGDVPHTDQWLNDAGEADPTRPPVYPSTNYETDEVREDGEEGEIVVGSGRRGNRHDRQEKSCEAGDGQPWHQHEDEQRHQQQYRQQQPLDSQRQDGQREHWQQRDQQYDDQEQQKLLPWQQQQQQPQQYEHERVQSRQENQQQNFQSPEQQYWQQYEKQQKEYAEKKQQQPHVQHQVTNDDADRNNCGEASTASSFNSNRLPTLALLRGAVSRTQQGTTSEGGVKSTPAEKAGEGLEEEKAAEGNDDGDQPQTFPSNRMPTMLMLANRASGVAPPLSNSQQPSLSGDTASTAGIPINLKDIALPKCFNSTKYPIKSSSKKTKRKGKSVGTGGGTPSEGPTAVIEDDATQDLAFPVPALQHRGAPPSAAAAYSAANVATHPGIMAPPYSNLSGSLPPPAGSRTSQDSSGHPSPFVGPQYGPHSFDHPPPHFQPSNVGQHSYHANQTGGLPMRPHNAPPQYTAGMPPMFGGPYSREMPLSMQMSFSSTAFAMDTEMEGVSLTEALDEELDVGVSSGSAKLPFPCSSHPPGYITSPPKPPSPSTPETSSKLYSLPPPPPKPTLRDISLPSATVTATASASSSCATVTTTCVISGATATTVTSSVSPTDSEVGRPPRHSSRFAPPPSDDAANIHGPSPAIVEHETENSRLSSISPNKRGSQHQKTEQEKIVSPEKVPSEMVSGHEGKSSRHSRSSTARSSREGHRIPSRSPSVHGRRDRGSSSRHSKSRESKRRKKRSRRSEDIIIPTCSTISLGSPTYSNVSSSSPPRTEVSPSPRLLFDDIPPLPTPSAEAPIREKARPPVADSTTTTTTASSVSGPSSQNDEGQALVPLVATAPIVSSTYFSLKRAMNKQKKLSKQEIRALIEPRSSSSALNKETVASTTVTSSSTGVGNDFKEKESTNDDVPSSTVDDETIQASASCNDGDVRTAESVAPVDAVPENEDATFGRPVAKATESVEDANDWFTALQSVWGRQEGGASVAAGGKAHIPATAGRRNKGGYLMAKPGEIPATQDELDMQKLHQNRKKKPRKKRNIENEIRKAAFAEGPTAPEDRIGPNAAQFLADEAEYLASLGGGVKRTRDEDSDDDAAGGPKKRTKKDSKKKKLVKKGVRATALVPLPYLRYVPDNHEFREFLYCYKHKEKEHQRKMQQLRRKKQQDRVGGVENEGADNQNDGAAAPTPEPIVPPVQVLRRMSPSVCSFAVRVWLAGTASFHVKWAEDLCHVFGLQFAPVKHQATGGWVLLSNEAEDGAAVLHLLKRYRLLDAVLHAALHYAAAALPKVTEDSVKVLKDRLALFAEKYDNTAARNLQQSIADGEQCSFFLPDWRNAYLCDLSALYTTVADAVRSLAKKQSGGWRQWSNGGVRVVAVVADSAAAVWCGGLVGAMAGRRGVSLIGGSDQLLISDVEHADMVVGTPSQLLHVFSRNFSVSGSMDQEERGDEGGISTKPPPRRHPLNPLAAVILDDVGHLAELPETTELLALLKTKARNGAALHTVAIAHRVFFHELEEAERALGCSFPRTALQEPTLTDLELPEAAEEQLLFQSKDIEKSASKEPAKESEGQSEEAAKELTDSAASAPLAGKRKQKAADGKNKQALQPVDKQQTQQKLNAASGQDSEDKQRNESKENDKRQREDVIDNDGPARPLTFLDELELMRAEQKRLKGVLDSDEEKERRRERREMEKTMQHLREQQKKRLAEEHRQMLEEKRKMRKENEEKFNRILAENSAENEELEKRKKENEAAARQAALLSAAHKNPGGAAEIHSAEVSSFKQARSERISVEESTAAEIQQNRAEIEVTSLVMEKDITSATTRKVIPITSREKAMPSVPKERSTTNTVDRRMGGVISRQKSLDSIPPKNIPTVASVSSVPVDPRRRVQSTESQDPQGGRTRELSLAEHLALLREKSKGGRPLTKEEEIENRKRLVLERRQREEREREERILQIERKEKEKLDKDRQEKERLEKELKQKLKERQRLLLQQLERNNKKETQRQRQREKEDRLKEEEEELQMAQARAMVARAQQLKEASMAALKRAEEGSAAAAYTLGKSISGVGPPSVSAVSPGKLTSVVRAPPLVIVSPGKLTSLVGSPSVVAASPEKLTSVVESLPVIAASPLKPATTTTSSGGVPLTPAQLRKQQQRRLLEEEKRRLEERIQQELLKKQQRKLEQMKKKEASNVPAAAAVVVGEKELLLQQEKRKRKMLLQESLQQEEMRKLKKVKQ